MNEFLSAYWPVIVIGILIGLVVGYMVFRPRQKVRLTETGIVRPHMTKADEAPPGAADPAPAATFHAADHAPRGAPDDLLLLKGVGPKLAGLLHDRGITRFDQIAGLSAGQVETLDASLGAFRGRFTRDRIVEQADYLARGDTDGFEARFGKL